MSVQPPRIRPCGILLYLSALGLLVGGPAQGEPFADPARPTLTEATAWALAHNPSLAAAKARLASARASADAEGYWPEPSLLVSASPAPIETRNGPAWASAALAQPIPWLGQLAAEEDAATAEARGAAQSLRLAELALARDLRQAWFAVHLADARVALNARMAAIVERIAELAQGRLAAGAGRQTDVLRVEVERARLANEGVDLRQQRITRQAALNTLLARPPQTPIPALPPPTPRPAEALDGLLAWAVAHHPELARQEAALDAARARLRVAGHAGRPRLTVGVGYTLIGRPDEVAHGSEPGQDAFTIQAGTTLPLWQSRYDAKERAASAALEAARQARDASEDLQVFRVLEQHVAVETALRRVRLLSQTLVPLASQTLDLLEAAYASDQARLPDLLDAERTLERLELDHAEALTALEQRLADLEYAVGRPVEAALATPALKAAPDAEQ